MLTNFGELNADQKRVWSRDVWRTARNTSFLFRFSGTGHNAMFQRLTELTKDERGDRVIFPLIADIEGDGVMGDYTIEGREDQIRSAFQTVVIDAIRFANRHAGQMAHQKTVVDFRSTSKDVLGYALGDRLDQMAFLTASGVAYSKKNNGGNRPALDLGMNLTDLAFAGDVTAPTANRHLRWVAASGTLEAGNTASVVATDTPSYKMLVLAKAYAKDHYMRGVKASGNTEIFHVFMTPQGMAKLKLDPDYIANLRNAGIRGDGNPLFSGGMVTQDGLVIHEFRHVYNTKGAASGSKWGASGTVDGQRTLFCGAQALAFADLGEPTWAEEGFDYGNQQGIAVRKVLGLKKPVFRSAVTGTEEDFGILCVDTAI